MNINNKNIDQIFKDAAHAEKAPEYNPVYWEEMSAILDAKDAKRKRFVYWTISGASVFVLLLSILFTVNYKDVKETTVLNEIRKVEQSLPKETHSEVEYNNTTSKEKEVNIAENNSFSNEKVQDLPQTESNNRIENQFFQSFAEAGKESVLKSSNPQFFDNSNIDLVDDEVDKSIETKPTKAQDVNWDINKLSPLQITSIEENTSRKFQPSLFEPKPRPSYSLYAKVSFGLMENYKTSRPFESGLFDLSLNFEVNTNNLLIRAGVGAQQTSNADLIVSHRKKVYDYGIVEVQSDLSYQGLWDIYIPLELGYKYRKTAFGVGVQANYLISTTMNLNVYENHKLTSSEWFTGKKNGLKSFSTQAYLWLEHSLTPRIALGLKVGTNISGRLVKNSNYFNNSSTTNPIYGQLALRFNILK